VQLLPKAIAEPGQFLAQIVVDARRLAYLNDQGMIGLHAAESGPVRPQRIGEDEGVAAIILRAGDAMAVAEAVELHRVEGEDVDAALQQGIDDLPAGTTNPVTVSLVATNVPSGTTVTVTVKGQAGAATSTTAVLAGTTSSSTASASVTISTSEPCVITASGAFTLLAAGEVAPVYAEGDEVEQVRVTAALGGTTRVAYVTRSGREVVVGPVR
jgi:hypothetical protein